MSFDADALDREIHEAGWVRLQMEGSHLIRPRIARLLADQVRDSAERAGVRPPFAPPPPLDPAFAARGHKPLDRLLAPDEAAAVGRWLAVRPCYIGPVARPDVDPPVELREAMAGGARHAAYAAADVLRAPHLLELANSDPVLAAVEGYLGCTPTLYAADAVWSFPGAADPGGGPTFRRDHDDFRSVTLHLFLTDTTDDDGGRQFLTGTQQVDTAAAAVEAYRTGGPDAEVRALIDRLGIPALFTDRLPAGASSAEVGAVAAEVFGSRVVRVSGGRGTAVLEDGFGFHRDVAPRSPRLVFRARYGLYRNRAYWADGGRPVPLAVFGSRLPDTPYHRFVNRLLIA